MGRLNLYPWTLLLTALTCMFTGPPDAAAQPGGTATWEFLNLTNSARVASLGGKNITLRDGDLNLAFHNPALLDSTMHHDLLLNYVNYYSDINFGYASYAFHQGRLGTFAGGIHYINYGSFLEADETGVITGNFTATENSVNLSWAKAIDSLFTAGAALKTINSSFEQYRAFGVALDAGINYYNPGHLLSVSLVMRNLGTQLTTWYPGGEREDLPFELQLGVSKQLEHAPFRLSAVYQHLQDFSLDTPKKEGGSGEPAGTSFSAKAGQIGNELLRHMIIGVEFLPMQSLTIRAGYNNLRRHEMRIDQRASTVGFSWGFGVRLNRFRIDFGQSRYHLAGSSHHFSVTASLASFYSRQ